MRGGRGRKGRRQAVGEKEGPGEGNYLSPRTVFPAMPYHSPNQVKNKGYPYGEKSASLKGKGGGGEKALRGEGCFALGGERDSGLFP